MTGQSTQTTTQNTSSEPWAAASPLLESGLSQASNINAAGMGFQPYTGTTVIPYAKQTTNAMDEISRTSLDNMHGYGSSGQYQNIIDNGGFNSAQSSAMGGLNNFANYGAGNVSASQTQNLGNMAMNNPAMSGYGNAASGGMGVDASAQRAMMSQGLGPSYSEKNLMGVARGDMLNRQDPNFERALSAASESAANQINLGASGSGRYGSAVHQGNVAREVGNYEAGQRVNQYNNERQNQMAANQAIDSQRMQGLGFGLSAANSASGIDQANRQTQMQGISGLGSTYANSLGQALGAEGQAAGIQANNYDRQMSALNQQFNAGQQGINNIGSAYQGLKAPAQDYMNVGSMYEDLASRMKNDELRLYDAYQKQPLSQTEWLMGIGSGAGQLGGTSTGTAQQPGQSPFATALGYGTGLASLFGG